jgi:hypothetical protein
MQSHGKPQIMSCGHRLLDNAQGGLMIAVTAKRSTYLMATLSSLASMVPEPSVSNKSNASLVKGSNRHFSNTGVTSRRCSVSRLSFAECYDIILR